ncbi:MAG: T9SS type A sorting domain-containing protein [Chitinophagales bacterium]
MKNKITLALFAYCLAFALSSYDNGYAFHGSDGTGATGSSGCSCHGSTTNLGTTVELDSAGVPVTRYFPGMSYTVRIRATNAGTTNWPKFGFQLGAVKLAGAGGGSAAQAGTWGTTLPTSVKNTPTSASGLPIPFIEHSFTINATTGTGGNGTTYVEVIPWTAPAAGTGSVKFYGIINACNGNGGSSGDKAQTATPITITEAAAAPLVASVAISITGGSNNSCAGSNITFTAVPTNGGTPTYSWKVNGATVGSNSPTYSSSTLTNGQQVTCVMTSSIAGVTNNPATSNVITMVVKAKSTGTINQSICQGQSYLFNGVNRTTAGTYLDTFTNTVGCDSVVTLNLTVKAKTAGTINQSVCPGQTYFFNGGNRTAPGTYLDTLLNAAGCDSILTLNLSLKNPTAATVTQSICQGQSYFFNGANRTVAGTYLDTLVNAAGCDSFITLNLIVKAKTSGTINKSICSGQSYFFNGANRTVAGTYLDTLLNAAGCDSILTLNLSINTFTSGTVSAGICQGQSYFFNGQNLTTTGVYKDTFTVAGSCDSIVTLNLTVKQKSSATINQQICSGHTFFFNGSNLSATGTYFDTLTNAAGCDSLITLNLSVKNNSSSTTSQSICQGQSYSFNGKSYSVAGTYRDTLLNALGCDSVAILQLTVNSKSATTLNQNICQGSSFTFNGNSYSTSGTYSATLLNGAGCDSVVTLHLNVATPTSSSIQKGICNGQSYFFNNTNLNSSGVYRDTIPNAAGCDSVITLTLTVSNYVTAQIDTTICSGSSITFNGQQITVAGTYRDTIAGAGSCDSVVTLQLSVSSLPVITIVASGNTVVATGGYSSYQWLLNGNALSTSASNSLTAVTTGDYSVQISNGICSNTSSSIHVVVNGIADIQNTGLQIAPNPVTDELIVHISNEQLRTQQIQIFDMFGKLVISQAVQNEKTMIATGNLPEGMYILRIGNQNLRFAKR